MPEEKQIIEVIFTKVDRRIWGHITKDCLEVPLRREDCYKEHAVTCLKMFEGLEPSFLFSNLPKMGRTKLVLLSIRAEKITPLLIPDEFEVWQCEVTADTSPSDPMRGILYVIPLNLLEIKKPSNHNREVLQEKIVKAPELPLVKNSDEAKAVDQPEKKVEPIVPQTDLEIIAQCLGKEKSANSKAQTIMNFTDSLAERVGWGAADQLLRTMSIKSICEKQRGLKEAETMLFLANENWIIGAIAYLENGKSKSATFVDKGKRYFQCQCGCMNRVGANDFHKFQSGESVDIRCTSCGGRGQIKK